MAILSKPSEPLRILTIDGGELHFGTTVVMLQKTLDAIAQNYGIPDNNLRACDVFDVIAGVGPGGWLALLLGRFHLDVQDAVTVYYDLMKCIKAPSLLEDLRVRLMQQHYDNEYLVEYIDELTETCQTDKNMFFTAPEGTRCKHVFVSALKNYKGGQHEYNLFRTYDCPKGANVLGGPENPRDYKTSHAFRATGAARNFTPLWTEPTPEWSDFKGLNIPPPGRHNITEIALNEVWGLYGKDVEISLVLNIGSAIPNGPDCNTTNREIARAPPKVSLLNGIGLMAANRQSGLLTTHLAPLIGPNLTRFCQLRQTTYGGARLSLVSPHSVSSGDAGVEEKPSRDENKMESDIEKKLRSVYPEHTPPYYRLLSAPMTSVPKTAPDYSFAIEHTKVAREEIGQRIRLENMRA